MADTVQEARARLAQTLLERVGLVGADLKARVAAAAEDSAFVELVAHAFVATGRFNPIPEDPLARPVRLAELPALPPCAELVNCLDRRRVDAANGLERTRLGELYALLGYPETAAQCLRQVFSEAEPVSLEFAITLAEACATAKAEGLALAAIDWVAECLLTRDEISVGPRSSDPIRRDPYACGGLLERARDVALAIGHPERAVALSRTAVGQFERVGRLEDARSALAGAARSLRLAGDNARAMGVAKRLRDQARNDGDPWHEAIAMNEVALQLIAGRESKQAIALHREAAKVLADDGETSAAAVHQRRVAELLVADGQLEQARQALEEAAASAEEAGAHAVALALQGEEAALALDLARVGPVLTTAEALRKGWSELGDAGGVARAVVLLARALVLAGDGGRARKALGRVALDLDPSSAAEALALRAEVAVKAGDLDEARLLLADARRAYLALGESARAGTCTLRRAELALEANDTPGCLGDLQVLQGDLGGNVPRQLELRMELLRVLLGDDPDEQELLLEDLYERANEGGLLFDRALTAVACAQNQLGLGAPERAEELLKPVLRELITLRDALPEPLRAKLRGSPLARQVLTLAEDPAIKKTGV